MNLFGNVVYLVFDIWILWTRSNVYQGKVELIVNYY